MMLFKKDILLLFDFFKHALEFDTTQHREAVDIAHVLLLLGLVVSHKPQTVLELGIGSGFCTRAILAGLSYNGVGKLTCVDSLKDFKHEPLHFVELRKNGAYIVIAEEYEFTVQSSDKYDFIVSDADHKESKQYLSHTFNLLNDNGLILFHDTMLHGNLTKKLDEMKIQYTHFNKSTRNDERCERGWLLARKHEA